VTNQYSTNADAIAAATTKQQRGSNSSSNNNNNDDPLVLIMSSSDSFLIILLCILEYRRRSSQRRTRAPMFPNMRGDVNAHIERYRTHPEIARALRFPIDSYDLLCDILRDSLTRNERMAKLRGGYITPEACVFMTLRWLAGGSHLDLIYIVGCSRSYFFELIWLTIDAIIESTDPYLDNIKFPTTREQLDEASQGFQSISFQGCIPNCVTVIDGYLLQIRTPSRLVGNVLSYFSGHYQCYGVNVQAAVDSKCRFQFIGVGGPGVSSDRHALITSKLFNLLKMIPSPYVAIGDAGYTAFEFLAAIFNAYFARNPKYDNFNYFASQLRIRVEMAFGLLVMKWEILQKPLRIHPTRIWKLVVALGRLHNFRINQREVEYTGFDRVAARRRFVPSQPQRRDGTPILGAEDDEVFVTGTSSRREYMALEIQHLGLARPRD
jgi:DDE superfamily endonuclease